MKTAVIVLPTYNEAGNIEKVVTQIFEIAKGKPNWDIQILVNDSSSKDGTADIVKKLQKTHKKLHLLETKKEGLGKAYTQGFRYAVEKLNAFVVMEMDADQQAEPKEIPNYLSEIEKGADFVTGTRYSKGGSIPSNWGFHRKFLSVVGNWIIRLGFMKLAVSDWTLGYRAIKAWVIKDADAHMENYLGYVFQIALLDYAIKKNAIIREVPIHFQERTSGESKISYGSYILDIFAYIFKNSSFLKFAIVGAIGFVVDFGIFYILTKFTPYFTGHLVGAANAISSETAVVTNYLLNNFWSFSHKKVEHSLTAYIKSFLKFNTVSLGNIGIQTVGIIICRAVFGDSSIYIGKVLIIIFIVIPFSYFFYNKLIWKDKK
jgi:dolichol-phosphate mannosyltransferase